MGLEIHIDNISREKWENFTKLFSDYNVYQTWPYQQVRAEMDSQNVSRVIVTDGADNPVTMCQMRIKNAMFLGLRIGYVQWGPLLRRKDNRGCPVEALRMLRDAFMGDRINILRLVPNIRCSEAGNLISNTLVQSGFDHVNSYNPYRTFILKVDDSCEQIRARLHKSFRRDLRKVEKLGLKLQQGTGEEFCKVLEDLYGRLITRKGFKGLNPNEFIKTQAMLSPSEKMNFIIVSQDGEPMAILLSAALGDTSLVLLASTSEKGLSCGASYLVWYQGALAAHNAGMKIYDLGGIDPVKNSQVYQFKSRIGGCDVSYIGAFEAISNPVVGAAWHLAERTYRYIGK
jgi:lipid II:glycine glycyltransferase (peptidoglycan interpeptide bridge formation enzyme)